MTRRMPKWHAVRGYGDFSNDPSLSPFEIALIAAWADGGAPRGTEADARMRRASAVDDSGEEPEHLPTGHATSTLPCGEQPAPEGTLLAVQPELEPDASAGISVRLARWPARDRGAGYAASTRSFRRPIACGSRWCCRPAAIVSDLPARGIVRAHPHDCGTVDDERRRHHRPSPLKLRPHLVAPGAGKTGAERHHRAALVAALRMPVDRRPSGRWLTTSMCPAAPRYGSRSVTGRP